jgi:hypothetical protein
VRRTASALLVSATVLTGAGVAFAQAGPDASTEASAELATRFKMVRSTGAVNAGCLQGAGADVTVKELGVTEKMTVDVHGLPPGTEYDLFLTQDSEAPFGVAWYQSDLRTDQSGNARVTVQGRFNVETFAVAPGTTDAPRPHDEPPFPDAEANPPFAPIHTFHLGLWFNSPEDAAAAGCPATVTPFNGEHNAGIQALSTRNFPQLAGPLSRVG